MCLASSAESGNRCLMIVWTTKVRSEMTDEVVFAFRINEVKQRYVDAGHGACFEPDFESSPPLRYRQLR